MVHDSKKRYITTPFALLEKHRIPLGQKIHAYISHRIHRILI